MATLTEAAPPAAPMQSSVESEPLSKPAWYELTAEAVFSQLGTTPAGLSREEVQQRLAQYGYNELTAKKRSAFVRFLLQFHNAMIYILLAAAFVTGVLLQEVVDTCVILGVVVLNVIIGFIQEGKAEAAIEALKKMIVSESTVLRDGRRQVIPTREVVPGDHVEVGAVVIDVLPAYNIEKRFHPRSSGHVGYLIAIDGLRIYHAGDTDAIPEMAGLAPDIALLPVSGTYVMNPDEALEAIRLLQPKLVVPMHYGDIVGTLADAERLRSMSQVPVVILPEER